MIICSFVQNGGTWVMFQTGVQCQTIQSMQIRMTIFPMQYGKLMTVQENLMVSSIFPLHRNMADYKTRAKINVRLSILVPKSY